MLMLFGNAARLTRHRYTNDRDSGGKGSGIGFSDSSWFGGGGHPSLNSGTAGERGIGWGAGGGSVSGGSGYSSGPNCNHESDVFHAGYGGEAGSDGHPVGGCGGGGGGAGGIIIPVCKNFNTCNQNNARDKTSAGMRGIVFVHMA